MSLIIKEAVKIPVKEVSARLKTMKSRQQQQKCVSTTKEESILVEL